jgi:hypothetical protein
MKLKDKSEYARNKRKQRMKEIPEIEGTGRPDKAQA